jgi:hypothetical protein
MANLTKAQQAERDEAIAALRTMIKPGDTVYTSLKHVSRSGMQREIALYVVHDGEIRCISWLAATAMRDRVGKRDGIVVGGCGMDMGFALVYRLGRTLFPEGGPLEHSPRRRQEERAGETRERNGGYLLKHTWL